MTEHDINPMDALAAPGLRKVRDTDLVCRRCGERLTCILTGPVAEPNTRATYVCSNDYGSGCAGSIRSAKGLGLA